MNIKLITLSNLIKFKELLIGVINNKINELKELLFETINTKANELNTEFSTKVNELNTGLATKSDVGHRHDNATTSKDGFMSASDKVKLNGLINYTAGEGIKIENGVIGVIERIKVGGPTCLGYTLYGDYFLSNTITPNETWDNACDMNEDVTVTQNYNYGSAETKTVTAKTLSKAELETLTAEQRKINENGHSWYWTSTYNGDEDAFYVNNKGALIGGGLSINGYSDGSGGTRLGFKNPFTSGISTSGISYTFDSTTKTLYIRGAN